MSLPAWLQPLPDAAQMQATDRWAIDRRGVPGLELMERAGVATARAAQAAAPEGRAVVVCGKGNNGGDGLVIARVLREAGREVEVLVMGEPGELRGDPAAMAARLPGEPPRPFSPAALEHAGVLVDAMLGTGFAGTPRDPIAGAIASINAADAVVVAVDVPSGVDASSGHVAGAAVRADVTVSFHQAKPGLWINPGKTCAGRVEVVDIGIPAGAPVDPSIGLIGPGVLDAVPRRGAASTKFSSGAVLLAGGSRGLTGAPCLAAEAAMRAGAGYVTAFVPASLNAIFEARLLEVMTMPVADRDGALDPRGVDALLARVPRGDALVLGPGIGRGDGAVAFARAAAAQAQLPLVLDADGLNAHAERLGELARRRAPTVLTPHAGELGRLLGVDASEVGSHRLEHARHAAEAAWAIIVLKGDDTLVVDPEGLVGVSPGGAPALATAGTGDVLSGVLGALLAKRVEPFQAACAAVLTHVQAGQRAAARIGADGVIASDVIDALPRVGR